MRKHNVIPATFLILSIVLLFNSPAASQEPTDQEPGDDETPIVLRCPERTVNMKRTRKLAGNFFARGEKAFVQKNYVKALRRFLCSMNAIEHPNTVTNINKVIDAMPPRLNETAASLLRQYIKMNPDAESNTDLEMTVAALEEKLMGQQGAVEREVAPPVALEVPPEPTTTMLNSDIDLMQRHMQKEMKLLKVLGAIELALGGALAGTGILTVIVAADARNSSSSKDDYKTLQGFSIGSLIGGAMLVTTGIIHMALHKKRRRAYHRLELPNKMEPDATATTTIDPTGLTVRF